MRGMMRKKRIDEDEGCQDKARQAKDEVRREGAILQISDSCDHMTTMLWCLTNF